MAEAAAETAPNGKSPNEDARVGDPLKLSNADDSLAKGLDDMKDCGNRGSKDEGAVESVTSKGSSDTKTAEVAAKETTGLVKGTGELMDDDLKATVVSIEDTQNTGVAKADVVETKGKDGDGPDVVKGGDAKDNMEIDADASNNESNKPPAEERVAIDIDDKKQGKPEEEQKAGVVVNPKKKGRRPKRNKAEANPAEEPTETEKAPKEEMETKKRQRQRREHPVTPLSERDRPARERKSIERFVASVDKGKKELVIKQGTGTPLMDIPNVAYKLAKRAKGDEILNMLHSLLYNKRGKASALKYNIYRFSGFVWGENEEKEKNKVKEKLERYTKEGLGQLIDVLDLHLPKTGKKEELVVKVLQFLESPHKTTDVSLGEKEQRLKEKKRKSRGSGRGRGGATPGMKRRKMDDSTPKRGRGRKKKDESESDGDGRDADASSGEEDLEVEEVERARLTFKESDEEDDDDDEDYEAKSKPQKKASKSAKNDAKEVHGKVLHNEVDFEGDQGPKKSSGKGESKSSANDFSVGLRAPSPDISRSTSKPPDKVYTKGSRKKNKELKEKEMLEKEEKEKEKLKEVAPERKRRGKEKEKSKEKNPEKTTGRGGRRGKEAIKKKKSGEIPSDDVLQNEIRHLLKDLSPSDFSKVTVMDIVVQLEENFNVDLSVEKANVKSLIKQEVSRLAEEATDEEAPAETDAPPEGEDEAQAEETAVASPEGKTSPRAAGDDKDADSDGAEESGDVSGETAAKDVDGGETSETVAATKSEQLKDAKKDVEQSQSSIAAETADGGAAETD